MLEILIALAIGVTSIVGAMLITFGTPEMLANARLEYVAYNIASALLTEAELTARSNFDQISSIAPISENGYESSLEVSYLHEDLAARLTARVNWTDTRGRRKEISLESFITDPESALDDACSPFPLGNWQEPRQTANHSLTNNDLLPGVSGLYPIADVVTTRDALLAGVSSTELPTDSSLFLFKLGKSGEFPQMQGAFDNASTSRTGYAAVSATGEYAYAANAFGSASPVTCSTGACAQLHVFDLRDGLKLISSFSLSMDAPPYAQSAGGKTSPAKALTYRKGYIYLGLEKTLNGMEFNIIDVHDPEDPHWIGGVAVGRSVNDISIQGTRAYLATSDPVREFIIVNIEDPFDPQIVGVWNAPGSANFGLGNVMLARAGRIYIGRSYVGNASEFYVFETNELTTPVYEYDFGTILTPRSVNGIIARGPLLAILVGSRLELWHRNDSSFVPFADPLELLGIGTSLACRGNTFYVGGVDESGNGFITEFTAS